jgi:hypothetical protein
MAGIIHLYTPEFNYEMAQMPEHRTSANGWRPTADYLALKSSTALLLVALVLAGTGERLWLGFAPKHLQTLGASILIIGLFDALQTLLGAVYAYHGGWLSPEANSGIDGNAGEATIELGFEHDNRQQDYDPAHPADTLLCGGGALLR